MPGSRQREQEQGPADGDRLNAIARPRSAEFLVIRLAGREYAIEASAVTGMVEMRSVDVQPAEPERPWRRSALIRGRTLPVVSAHTLLGLKERPTTARSCLVLISSHGRHPNFALIADSVSRIETVRPADWRGEALCEWVQSQVRLGEKWRGVLDLRYLAEVKGLLAA